MKLQKLTHRLLLTFFFGDHFEEAFDVVALSNHVNENVVLFPGSFVLIIIHELGGLASVEPLSFVHVFLLLDIFLLCAGEGCP